MPNPYMHHQKPNQKKKSPQRWLLTYYLEYTNVLLPVIPVNKPKLKLQFSGQKQLMKNKRMTTAKLFPSGCQEAQLKKQHLSTSSLLEDWVSVAKMPIRTHKQILRKKSPNIGYNKPHYCYVPVFLYGTQPHLSTSSYW